MLRFYKIQAKNAILPFATMRTELEDIMLTEITQSRTTVIIRSHGYEASEKQSRRSWGEKRIKQDKTDRQTIRDSESQETK